jgi:hypothetical protein
MEVSNVHRQLGFLKSRNSIVVLVLYVVVTLTDFSWSFLVTVVTANPVLLFLVALNDEFTSLTLYQFLDYKTDCHCVSTGIPEEQICMWSACMDWKWCTKSAVQLKIYPFLILTVTTKTTSSLGSKLNEPCRLRLLADSKGYVLDDTGLYLATRGRGGKHVRIFISSRMGIPFVQFHLICYNFLQAGRSDAIVNCDTEKDVFETLGFPWLEPHERNL